MYGRSTVVTLITLFAGGLFSGLSIADNVLDNKAQLDVFMECAVASSLSAENIEYVDKNCAQESDLVPCVARSSGKQVKEGQLTDVSKEALLKCMSDALKVSDG
jgi:hypothetical protein